MEYFTLEQKDMKLVLEDTTHLSLCRWCHIGVFRLTDDVLYVPDWSRRNVRERLSAVIGEVTVHLPRFPEVIRPLDQHSSWSEGLKSHN